MISEIDRWKLLITWPKGILKSAVLPDTSKIVQFNAEADLKAHILANKQEKHAHDEQEKFPTFLTLIEA